MPKTTTPPIFRKVSSILVAKMRKPIIPIKLIFLKKTRKLKRFKLVKHYSYSFLKEYEFSPPNTPLIKFDKRGYYKDDNGGKRLFSLLFMCNCLGGYLNGGRRHEEGGYYVENSQPLDLDSDSDSDDDVDDCVDQRAEKFIEWFYQEMRLQRQDSM